MSITMALGVRNKMQIMHLCSTCLCTLVMLSTTALGVWNKMQIMQLYSIYLCTLVMLGTTALGVWNKMQIMQLYSIYLCTLVMLGTTALGVWNKMQIMQLYSIYLCTLVMLRLDQPVIKYGLCAVETSASYSQTMMAALVWVHREATVLHRDTDVWPSKPTGAGRFRWPRRQTIVSL